MTDPIDFEDLAQATESMREVLGVMVAGLVTDGFTDEQARAIVTSLMVMNAKGENSG